MSRHGETSSAAGEPNGSEPVVSQPVVSQPAAAPEPDTSEFERDFDIFLEGELGEE